MTFYIENAGSNVDYQVAQNAFASNFSHLQVADGVWAYHFFRRFVVVKNSKNEDFSYCWWV